MDPLSATLAVISLATMVKDIVELGQKIHESFSKASNNHRSAHRIAEDIKEMVEEIKIFYNDHKDALADMKDFRLALQGLLDKFQSFNTSILPLLARTGGRKRDRLIRGWDTWRNGKKIEKCILDLQSEIVKVMRRYMMKSAMRAEVKLETIHQETSRGLTGISQGLEVLEVVRRDVSALYLTTTGITTARRPYESSGTSSDEFNQNVIMFAKSTPSASAPMLRTPSVITEELMTTAYIRLQINHIVMALERISELPASIPNSVDNFLLSTVSIQKSMSITHLRHRVVRQVIGIRDLFDTKCTHTISIHEGARALNNLSVELGMLHMGHESIQLGKWAIMLARILVDTSCGGHPDLCAAFALYLSNQSVQYYNNGDMIQSLQASKEAYAITQNLRNQYSGEVRFQILYSEVLLQYAQLVDIDRSIEMLVEAVQILEAILNTQGFAWQSQSPIQIDRVQILQPSSSFFDHLFSKCSALPMTAISNYAFALQKLGIYLRKAGHSQSDIDLELLAIKVRRKIVFVYGHEYKADLAGALSLLVHDENARSLIPAEELVDMAEECIGLLRELAESNPLSYARQLINVLWAKAKTLEILERDAEAIATWEEVVSLARQFVEDSRLCAAALTNLADQFRRLKRHNEAARTTLATVEYQHGPEMQALRYTQLYMDLGRLRRFKESAEAARTAVPLCRHVAMRDPGIRTSARLVVSLSDLSHCLAASGDYSGALIAWKESVSMLENFLSTKPDASSSVNNNYIDTLREYTVISYVLKGEEDSLKVSLTAAQYLRQLSEMCCPQKLDTFVNLLWAEFCYAYNMFRFGRLQDGLRYIEEWLDVWKGKLEVTSDSEIVRWHAIMTALKSDILDAQGRTGDALLCTQSVYDIVKPFSSTYQPSFVEMIKSMIHKARLLMDLDNSEEALKITEETLRLARDNHKLDLAGRRPVRSLHGFASTALLCRNYTRAAEVAREGCDICASQTWLNSEGEANIFIRPSFYAILSSAEANLGRCSTAVAYAHRAVDESLEIGDNKLWISSTAAEQSYMETRGNLADILLAVGNLTQARQICDERRTYFSKRVEKRMGDYRELAPILRMLGILCCSEGRHEEGEAAAQELSQIVRTLGSAFPSLQEQVKIRLRRQANVPILKVLDEMSQKLDCEHQEEVVSLLTS